MTDASLLGSINKKEVSEFKKDLLEMLRIGIGLDKSFDDSRMNEGTSINKFDSLIKEFNKKYKNLKLKLLRKIDKIELKILLNEKNVKDAFGNSASKIIGVQSIGSSKFGTVMVSDVDKYTNELEKAKDKLFITYYNPNTGSSNVFLQYDNKEKKVQLVYDSEDMENETSSEFQIAAYYALSQGHNKKIKLHDEAITLGFSEFPDHLVKRKYLEKHDPHLSE